MLDALLHVIRPSFSLFIALIHSSLENGKGQEGKSKRMRSIKAQESMEVNIWSF
jgi:hypothetical protein